MKYTFDVLYLSGCLNKIGDYVNKTNKKHSFYIYSVTQKDGLNFVRLNFLNYMWYMNDLQNISKRRS